MSYFGADSGDFYAVKAASGTLIWKQFLGFTVAGGRIAEIDAIADAERVRRITAAALGDG